MLRVPVDQAIVDDCRVLARQIAADVHSYIDTHTSVGVERTTLRALGVDGVDEHGVPLVNAAIGRGR